MDQDWARRPGIGAGKNVQGTGEKGMGIGRLLDASNTRCFMNENYVNFYWSDFSRGLYISLS